MAIDIHRIDIQMSRQSTSKYDLTVDGRVVVPCQGRHLVEDVRHRLVYGVPDGQYYRADRIARSIIRNLTPTEDD
ncbi:MAG: hypothetical protein JRI80_00455 [Deltaproteobacteria bacterium]|nr:hypothetical protein [Deltaproteobacteria bacterium]